MALYEDELRGKAQAFIEALVQAGVHVAREPLMVRDYMIKLAVGSAGAISIYYSPKRNEFSLRDNELRDKELAQHVQVVWDELNRPATAVEIPEVTVDPEEIEYYFNILEPHRHQHMDFIQLARVLQDVTGDQTIVDMHRYNFDELERIYHTIRTDQ